MKIPEKGLEKSEIFEELEAFRTNDIDWRSGTVWGYVYDAGREAEELCHQAYMRYLSLNALDPTIYPSVLKLENALVAMARTHLNGDEEVVGNFTSGGTESIILAVKSARNYARKMHPEIEEPEMVLPLTAHAAFFKAAHYLDVKAVPVPMDEKTYKADVAAMADAITPNTILLVGSAPSYAHGVIDPIPALGELALENDLLLHVDACIGGFLLPYFARLGDDVPPFDLSVPGVSSISMDLHKYAYAAKGASLVLYRDRTLRKHQIFACAGWPGYTVVNNTVQSSKSAGPMAGAWAVLHHFGEEGYLEIARRLREGTRKLVEGIRAIDGLYLLVEPEMTLIPFRSDEINIFHLADAMKERGWYVQVQLAIEGSPENLHLSVNPSNVDRIDDFLEHLNGAVDEVRGTETSELARTVSEAFAEVDPEEISDDDIEGMIAMTGAEAGEVPEDMADINEILNAIPPRLRERLLTAFVNEMFVP